MPMSAEVNPWLVQPTCATAAFVMPEIEWIVLGHSFGDGGVTEGGTALEGIHYPFTYNTSQGHKALGLPIIRRM
jgi:hypothetical protein